MIYSLYFKIFIFFIFLLVSLGLFKLYGLKAVNQIDKKKGAFIFFALLAVTMAVRLLYLHEIGDVDTSTWLSSVVAFNHYPSKLWVLLNYTDSRPLTVLPLIVGHWFGIPVSDKGSEIVGMLLWAGTIALLYITCNLFTSRRASLIIVWSLCLFVGSAWYGYAVYNSEHVSILMITASMTAYITYVYHKWNSNWISLLVGILLGSLIYAKFQNVPMGLLTGAFLLFEMIQRKKWNASVALLSGSILPTLLINVYYGLNDKLETFWNNYFWNNFYYSYTVQFSNVPIAARFSIHRMYHFILYAGNTGYYLITLSVLFVAALLVVGKNLFNTSVRERKVLIFMTLFVIASVYAVLQSGNDFQHYKLYVIVPYLVLVALLIFISPSPAQKYLIGILIIGSLLQAARSLKDLKYMAAEEVYRELDSRVIASINKNSGPSQPIVIWGWRDLLYVEANRPMGYRDAHVFHFSLKSPLIPYWTRDFMDDMEENKPELFIDAMIPVYSERGHLLLSHDQVRKVNEYIQKKYQLIEQFDGVRIFKRRK
jgi:hypothetical protein